MWYCARQFYASACQMLMPQQTICYCGLAYEHFTKGTRDPPAWFCRSLSVNSINQDFPSRCLNFHLTSHLTVSKIHSFTSSTAAFPSLDHKLFSCIYTQELHTSCPAAVSTTCFYHTQGAQRPSKHNSLSSLNLQGVPSRGNRLLLTSVSLGILSFTTSPK